MEKFPLTRDGFVALEAELKKLKYNDRPNIIAAIDEARSHGDLSENAEYAAAKEKQSFIEGRIKELEAVISRAQVIDPKEVNTDVIRFGATVLLVDEDNDRESSYQIVGDYEADIEKNKISLSSPLARAIIGREIGDVVEYIAPGGKKSFEILNIEYK
ncbi:MAG: transcription elongation factor GreA [Lactobacillaceae bacterium]|jgi:transcription elongation factor GreA|nr:transcription elongation factor GreA [Lactobacillaceae bacterium]